MREYLPLLIVCAVIGVFTILFLTAYAVLKRKNQSGDQRTAYVRQRDHQKTAGLCQTL